jgi:hypothetical protein
MPTEVEELSLSIAPADGPKSDDRDFEHAHEIDGSVRSRVEGAKTV